MMMVALSALFRQPRPKSPVSRGVVWIIGFIAFLNVYSMQAVLPMVKNDLETNSTTAGLLVGITLLAMALVSPFTGMVSDFVGRKKIVCSSMVVIAVFTALIPLCRQFWPLMVMRFFQGLAVPGIIVVTIAYISEELPLEKLGRYTSSYISGTIMGGFFGRFVTGYISHWWGWQSAFFFLAVLSMLGAALVWKKLPPSIHFTPNPNMRSGFEVLGKHLKNKQLLATFMVGFCVLYALVACFTYVTLLLDHPPFNLSAIGIANLFCVYLIGVVVTPMTSKLTARMGSRLALLCALLLSMAGLCLSLIPSLAWVIMGLCIGACGIFISQSISIAYLALTVTQGRSLATGLYYMAYYIGGAIGTLIAGIAFDFFHWPGSVTSIIAIELVAIGIAWHYWRPKQ